MKFDQIDLSKISRKTVTNTWESCIGVFTEVPGTNAGLCCSRAAMGHRNQPVGTARRAIERGGRAALGSRMNRAQSSDALDLETALPLPLAHFQRVALLGELTASLAHEINQPLAAIMANAHAASAMLAARKESRSAVRETVRDIAENAKHAAAIVSRLRSLLRREAPVFVAIDVAKCVDDAVEFASAEIARRCIVVRRFPVAAHLVEGDAVQLQQVFLNLLMNACDAIDRGPAGQREITVYVARSSPNRIEVAIRDSGCGFEGEELDRIFDHFVSTKPHGLGMGLAISKSIVQAHGGRIWASRNSTGGLTLHVALPLCAESWDHENPRNGLCRR